MSLRASSSFVEKVCPVLARMDDPQDEQQARLDPVDDDMRSRTVNTNGRSEHPLLSRDLGIEEELVKLAEDRPDVCFSLRAGPRQSRVVPDRIEVSLSRRRRSVFPSWQSLSNDAADSTGRNATTTAAGRTAPQVLLCHLVSTRSVVEIDDAGWSKYAQEHYSSGRVGTWPVRPEAHISRKTYGSDRKTKDMFSTKEQSHFSLE